MEYERTTEENYRKNRWSWSQWWIIISFKLLILSTDDISSKI